MGAEASVAEVEAAWGLNGLRRLLPVSDLVVIVDVLSFSTAVDVAVAAGAAVLPYVHGAEGAEAFARSQDALLARPRSAGSSQLSLSPRSLAGLEAGTRVVLPSPNGSALSCETGGVVTLAGCLRNAAAVAEAAAGHGGRVAVIAAGERWPDGGLRPALEDQLGAGAILERLDRLLGAEAEAMRAAYRALRARLAAAIGGSQSGRELAEAGFAGDVEIALAEDASAAVPRLVDGAYRNVAS